jgi:polysaccharide export outer membrane protein
MLPLVTLLALVACGHTKSFVWVDNYQAPARPQEGETLIARGDVLQIRVFNQEQLSTRTRVRPDGRITVPLLNDVEAAGRAPPVLARDIEAHLKAMVKNAVVTVSVEESRPKSVLVVGQVNKPSTFLLDNASGVLQALVSAGGLTADASDDGIFVVRSAPAPARIRFTYDDLLDPRTNASAFKLQEGDVVVVE